MFPTKFANNSENSILSHNAIQFFTSLPSNEVIKMLQTSIRKFLTPDRGSLTNNLEGFAYQDKRVDGKPTILAFKECCAFTKNVNGWHLYPIHKKELKGVGLIEDDLIEWIKFLNDMRVGFKYLYLGEQESIEATDGIPGYSFVNYTRSPTNTFYWVAVAPFGTSTDKNIPYLHWICLRYLTNSLTGGTHRGLKSNTRLAYYNIPRIVMMLHKEWGLSKFKAFLYAHIANPFSGSKSLAFSDSMGRAESGLYFSTQRDREVWEAQCAAPCMKITSSQFRKLLQIGSYNGSINALLTKITYDKKDEVRKIPGLEGLEAPYDPNELYALFDKGDYKGFIKAIEKSYRKSKSEKNGKEKVTQAG